MKNYFEYKNYIGKIEMSVEDGIFFGTIHGINDLVTFEGESFTELENAFREAVDDYLDLCKECGKEPQKAYKGQFNVRIPAELHRNISIQAMKEGITLNQFAVKAFSSYINNVDIGKNKVFVIYDAFKAAIRDTNGWASVKPSGKMNIFDLSRPKQIEGGVQ